MCLCRVLLCFPKANNCYSIAVAASCPLRLEILKDILDDWVKSRSFGSSFSRAAEARRTEEPWQIIVYVIPSSSQVKRSCKFTRASDNKGHDLFAPFQFISDESVEQCKELMADIMASFGTKQPVMSTYKVSCALCTD